MIKSGKIAVSSVIFLLIFAVITGLAGKDHEFWAAEQSPPANEAKAAAAGESLDELKALWQDASSYETARDRAGLIYRISGIARRQLAETDREDWIDWLWKIADTDASPYCRQACLAALYMDLGQEKALEQYVRDTDQNGTAALTQEDHVFRTGGPDWRLLRDACQKYPRSYLARGVEAYEAVRGIPYFEIERAEEPLYNNGVWVPPYGDEEYDPDREIPGWEKFLAEFPRHPATDDAAYRLARCYEIEGRFSDAVKTMQQARFLTDGDMRYAAAGRLVYILDVRMTYEQLEALATEKLEPPLQAFVSYSLAVREVRRENYARAAAGLEEFLEQEEALAAGQFILPFDYVNDYDYSVENAQYDLRGSVEKQLAEVKELAGLQSRWEESKDPADLYQLAAAIFHNEMLYYNHLWAGERQEYNWLGFINTTGHGHAPAEMAVFVQEMINCNHSLPYFQQVYREPSAAPELKARALYSAGRCYIGLDEWGDDAMFAFNPSDIRGKIISTYRQFVEEYPDSSMADDALLTLGAYTGDAAYPQRILAEYPASDTVEKANDLIKEFDRIKDLIERMESPYYFLPWSTNPWVPFKIMSPDDESVPLEIRNWAAANAKDFFTGVKTLGEWSYACVSAGEKSAAGYTVGIIGVRGESNGKLKVYYRMDSPAPGQAAAPVTTCPSVLVRLPATGAAVEFAEGFPQ